MIVPYDAINLSTVALLAEGVDRNRTVAEARTRIAVALLAEGVDRNTLIKLSLFFCWRRPPRGGRG